MTTVGESTGIGSLIDVSKNKLHDVAVNGLQLNLLQNLNVFQTELSNKMVSNTKFYLKKMWLFLENVC